VTQTALSVAVSRTFRLIELRYGRLAFGADGLVSFWIEEFLKLCPNKPTLPPELDQYYYPPPGKEDNPGNRFYHRKSFGELVTLLATLYNQRRDEQMGHLPLVERLPWMTRCASSDHRPAVFRDDIYGNLSEASVSKLALSEASVRKLAVGRLVKRGGDSGLSKDIKWELPKGIEQRDWSRQWVDHLKKEGNSSAYAKHPQAFAAVPAFDTHQIGAAGNGFIGLIYADGNNVGRAMATQKTPGAYKQFSQKLEDAAREAVFAALAEHLNQQRLQTSKAVLNGAIPSRSSPLVATTC
jgi:CRISPR-associated protein Cmr2